MSEEIPRHGPIPIPPSALDIEEATFLGETSPISPPEPVGIALIEAITGESRSDGSEPIGAESLASREEGESDPPPRFLVGLHATDPALGSGMADKRDSLIGISPPLPTGSSVTPGDGGMMTGDDSAMDGADSEIGVPILIWYRNPFPIEKTESGPMPNWTQIRPFPPVEGESIEASSEDGESEGSTSFVDRLADAESLDVAATLWHGPPANPGGKSGPIRDNDGNVIGDTGTIGPGDGNETLILLGGPESE